MNGCPHPRIADCPLYVVSHDARFTGAGCVRAGDSFECRVSEGKWAYERAMKRAIKRAFDIARINLFGAAQ